MSKPILDVTLSTAEGRTAAARAVVDSGSFYTIVRESVLPPGVTVERYPAVREMRTAAAGGRLRTTGQLVLEVSLVGKTIQTAALVSPDLGQEMLLGARTMQEWDISIRNRNGDTVVEVGRDMRDPDLMEVD